MGSDRQSETLGVSILNCIEGCGVFQSRVIKLLSEKGIENIESDVWYPLQTLLDVIEELGQSIGPNILAEMGKAVPKHAHFPPEVDSFEKVLVALDVAYKSNNRYGNIGKYEVMQVAPRKYHIMCDSPYPPQFNLGLLRGLSRKFSTLIRIEQLETELRGGEFIVKW